MFDWLVFVDQFCSSLNLSDGIGINATESKGLRVELHERQTALDEGKSVVVAFLDISKAFDNVNHQTVLLDLAQDPFSNLSHCSKRVVVNGRQTDFIPLKKGVPQGCILAPLLFNIYVAHLPDLVTSHLVEMPSYADDLTL